MEGYRCPVCHKKLTKREYERALGELKAHDKHTQHQLEELTKKLRLAQINTKKARKEGIEVERANTRRLLKGKDKDIQRLKERINQLQRGTTPQTEGLEFEDILTKRLHKEFPHDIIEHKGKGGDVLQTVMYESKSAGIIIYECKRMPRWQNKHIEQTYHAKISRHADYAILVTTANPKRGWNGFGMIRNVLVVSPLAVISTTNLLRSNLIEMLKAKIPIQKRAKIAQQLLKYVTSQDYKNPIEEVVRTAYELQEELKGEMKDHVRIWKKRWDNYQNIGWNTQLIQENVQRLLQGKEVKPIGKPKPVILQLPGR